jgi:transposase InsO family protein
VTRYLWVLARKAEDCPVTAGCQVAEVSISSFNDWRRRREVDPIRAQLEEGALVVAMRKVADDFDGTYGSPRMTVELQNQGWVLNHKRIERLMALHGIVGVHKPAKARTTIPAEHNPPLPDLVGRRFKPGQPDVVWVSDITYIPTSQGWLYLATVIDLGSRRLLGYAMANHMRTQLIIDALDMAAGIRGGRTRGIIFHSDRGSQYMSKDYAKAMWRHRMRQSVGRTGVCWDNAVAESWFSSLKRELVSRYRFATHPHPSTAGHLCLDRPLQHPQAALQPRLPFTQQLRSRSHPSGQPGRVNQVTGKRGEAQTPTPFEFKLVFPTPSPTPNARSAPTRRRAPLRPRRAPLAGLPPGRPPFAPVRPRPGVQLALPPRPPGQQQQALPVQPAPPDPHRRLFPPTPTPIVVRPTPTPII